MPQLVDAEQQEAITGAPNLWQLIVAGPGTGKTAVACQRIAWLISAGVAASRIMLISFTRTAIAELRARLISDTVVGELARSVRLSTLDSQAWNLRCGCDDEPLPTSLENNDYNVGIGRVLELFDQRNPDLWDFMCQLEHLVIDEAQDIVGVRAQLVMKMLRSLSPACGVTILADPAQAIYGFTTDDDKTDTRAELLLDLLRRESPRALHPRQLVRNHRVTDPQLSILFAQVRQEVERTGLEGKSHLGRVRATIRGTANDDIGLTDAKSLAERLHGAADSKPLVLFRRRADVLVASSYCASRHVPHRLRLSDIPVAVSPWIGWLLQRVVGDVLDRGQFNQHWQTQAALASEPFVDCVPDGCWSVLHCLAAGVRPGTIDLARLRALIARRRPPIEVCVSDLVKPGPILGTIHASKGREATTVLLILPKAAADDEAEPAALFEESRVCYVGATRARERLIVGESPSLIVGRQDSGRIYRFTSRPGHAQMEMGRDGDVERLAHLRWDTAQEIQRFLASSVDRTLPVEAHQVPQENYVSRLKVRTMEGDKESWQLIGDLSGAFRHDLCQLWNRIDKRGCLKPPPRIQHLWLVEVTTVALTEQERETVSAPFKHSGFALAPVVRGFPTIPFFRRES